MYFGNREVTLWYRGGHQTLSMATIDGINFTLDDEQDMRQLRAWAERLRLDSSAPFIDGEQHGH
jgi:hypothetical protein